MEFTLLFPADIGVLISSTSEGQQAEPTSESPSSFELTTHGLRFFNISFSIDYNLLWGDAEDDDDIN